ncbi:MAG: hypothetical protein GF411_05600 [Candidatus Lokiarchaeota archaeon]|nr:hypothetical protein [Candidatus Lokiarchaeota archaeon]
MNSYSMVKLGGSVITYKNQSPPKSNREIIRQIATEITHISNPMIFVLGGGAHGHQAAHKFGYNDSSTSKSTLLSGIPLIRHNMTILSLDVESIFNSLGIPSVVVSPFNFVMLQDGVPLSFPVDIILKILESGCNVLIHGDVCYDLSKGSAILSGDTIIAEITKKLPIDSIFVGTDVDGIFIEDPKENPSATFIPKIERFNLEQVLSMVGPSKSKDVTGGMLRKIQELVHISKNSRTIIFNLLVPGRLKSLLSGKDTKCTIIEL